MQTVQFNQFDDEVLTAFGGEGGGSSSGAESYFGGGYNGDGFSGISHTGYMDHSPSYNNPTFCSDKVSPGQYNSLAAGWSAVAGIVSNYGIPGKIAGAGATGMAGYNAYCANWNQ